MALAKDVVTFFCNLKHRSQAAILLEFEDTDGYIVEEWFPLSQLEEIHEGDFGEYSHKVVCQKWLAVRKGVV